MITFWWPFGCAYLAATLLPSGVSHLFGFGSFRDLLRTHAIIPQRLATPVALTTLLAELVAGSAALILLPLHRAAAAMLLFGGTAVVGLGFLLYVRRLLGRPGRAVSCGCSPLAAPLTSASVLPGAMLAVVSVTALAVTVIGDRLPGVPTGEFVGALSWFPPLSGVTLAAVVMLVPASAPSPATEGRW